MVIDGNIFSVLHTLSITEPEMVTVTIDEDGEFEFEVDYDLFMQIIEEMNNEPS
tara:strand:- start:547 stop:708 length:162 start_codon:yes stop_codon:yes gene_type:complete